MEGTEEFELVLRTPINAGLGQASETVVAIDDSISDCEFLSDIYCMYMFLYNKNLAYLSGVKNSVVDSWLCAHELEGPVLPLTDNIKQFLFAAF